MRSMTSGSIRTKPWTDKQKSYAAQVTRIDSDVGELVDLLKELGKDKRYPHRFRGGQWFFLQPQVRDRETLSTGRQWSARLQAGDV